MLCFSKYYSIAVNSLFGVGKKPSLNCVEQLEIYLKLKK